MTEETSAASPPSPVPNQFASPAATPTAAAPASAPPPAVAAGDSKPDLASALASHSEVQAVLSEAKSVIAAEIATAVEAAKEHIDGLVADFENHMEQAHKAMDEAAASLQPIVAQFLQHSTEVAAHSVELAKGGLVARLGELEMAFASHAAPTLSSSGGDSHGLLQSWFARFKGVFERRVAAEAEAAAPPAPPAA